MQDLVVASVAGALGLTLAIGARRLRPLRALICEAPRANAVVAAAIGSCALALESRATGMAVADAVLRVVVAVVATWGGGVVGRLAPAVVASAVIGALVLTESPLFVVGAIGAAVLVVASVWPARAAIVPLHAIAAGGCVLHVMSLHGAPTGVPSALAAGVIAPLWAAAWLDATPRVRTMSGAAVGLVVVGFSALVLAGAATAWSARDDVEQGIDDANRGLDAAAHPDRRDEAIAALEDSSRRLHAAEARLDRWWVRAAEVVPVAGRAIEAGREVLSSGTSLAASASSGARAIDVDRLRPADGRFDVAELRRASTALDEVRVALANAHRRIDDAAIPWMPSVLEEERLELLDQVQDARQKADDVANGAKTALDLLGADGPRRVLLLQMSNAESRAVGGWPGSYAVVDVVDGVLRLSDVGRTGDDLVARSPLRLDASQEFVDRYGSEGLTEDVRPLFLTPDFPTSARLLAQAYEQIVGRRVDAVIAFDAYGFASLLRITGPLTVPGWPVPLTADNAVQVLLHDQYRVLGDDRGLFQAAATQAVFDRLTTALDADIESLVDVLRPTVEERRLQLYASAPASQAFFDDIGASGAVPPLQGDYLGVVTQNRVGNKIDWFLRREISYEVALDPVTGAVSARATIRLQNDAPASGLPALITGSLEGRPTSPGLNRLWFNLGTPLVLQRATIDGAPLTLLDQPELGRRTLSAQIEIPPMGVRTIVVELAGTIAPSDGGSYRLDVGRQPTVGADAVRVRVVLPDGWTATPSGGLRASSSTVMEGSFDQRRPMTFTVDPKRS